MKKVIMLAIHGAFLLACSSSTTPTTTATPACTIEGSYAATITPTSGTCGSNVVTEVFTLAKLASGGYSVSLQNDTGTCDAQPVGACGIHADCATTLSDPANPADASGSNVYDFTFTSTGFTGTYDLTAPASKTGPACSGEASVTSTRQ